jgi:hypothetical protein
MTTYQPPTFKATHRLPDGTELILMPSDTGDGLDPAYTAGEWDACDASGCWREAGRWYIQGNEIDAPETL